jgi:tetratricopeptide (TPR) repeat protein
MGPFRTAVGLLAGRWQIPLAICAVVLASATLYRLKPAEQPVVFDALLADVIALKEAGASVEAADALANLLEMDLPPQQRAILHDYLAQIVYRQEEARARPNLDNVRLVLLHHESAAQLGHVQDATRRLRGGRAQEWLGEHHKAIKAYRRVLEQDPLAGERREALQGLVRLLGPDPEEEVERRRCMELLLADEGLSDAYLWWALQQAVQHAMDQDDPQRARQLLAQHGERLKRSDLKGYHGYLQAWILVREQRYEEAEPLVRWIDEWVADRGRADSELDRFGYLPAMCCYLLGQIDLGEQRPQAALAEFERARRIQPHGDLLIAATIGCSQALAMLERHGAACQMLRDVLGRLGRDGRRHRGLIRFRDALLTLSDQRLAREDYDHAIAYLDLAVELTPVDRGEQRLDLLEGLGKLHEKAATWVDDADLRQAHHAAAACCLEQVAELTILDESRHATLLWSAAQQYDQAGRLDDTRRLLAWFVEGRELDPRLPQALLQLGQACEAEGQLEAALGWYEAVIDSFPKLEEAARGKLLGANCLMALGEDRWGRAESLLRGLLEDEHIAPDASVFRDGLLALCHLLYQQQRYAELISRLEEFLVLYPDDAQRIPSSFRLADAYRQSAYLLREHAAANGPAAQVQAESRARFRRAAGMFARFLEEVRTESDADGRWSLFERLSLFYRGDCLFELNEARTLDEALVVYREAVARYESEPAALTAQVQIANIYLRQGKLREAARAVERARWMLRGIPDEFFEQYADGTDRAYWERYFTTVSSSELFQDAFAERIRKSYGVR